MLALSTTSSAGTIGYVVNLAVVELAVGVWRRVWLVTGPGCAVRCSVLHHHAGTYSWSMTCVCRWWHTSLFSLQVSVSAASGQPA